LVFSLYATIKMMHGPINIRFKNRLILPVKVPEDLVIPYACLNELHFRTTDFTFDYCDVT